MSTARRKLNKISYILDIFSLLEVAYFMIHDLAIVVIEIIIFINSSHPRCWFMRNGDHLLLNQKNGMKILL